MAEMLGQVDLQAVISGITVPLYCGNLAIILIGYLDRSGRRELQMSVWRNGDQGRRHLIYISYGYRKVDAPRSHIRNGEGNASTDLLLDVEIPLHSIGCFRVGFNNLRLQRCVSKQVYGL